MVASIAVSPSALQAKKSHSLEWSLKPYIIWMKLVTGISINGPTKGSGIFIIYGAILLLANIAVNGMFNWLYITSYFNQTTPIPTSTNSFIQTTSTPTRYFNQTTSTTSYFVNQTTPKPTSYFNQTTPTATNSTSKNATDSSTSSSSSCSSSTSSTSLISTAMALLNKLFMVFGVHCCFYIISFTRLKSLWQNLMQIQDNLDIPTETFYNIRKIVFWGFLLLIWDYSTSFVLNLQISSSSSSSSSFSTYQLYLLLICIAGISSSSIIILFWIMVSTTIALFRLLGNRIRAIVSRTSPMDLEELLVWKNHHAMVCHLVSLINRCFGSVVLISICHGFLIFIANFYQFVVAFEDSNWSSGVSYLLVFLQQVILLSIIIVVSTKLQREGSKFQGILFRLQSSTTVQVQNVLNSILIQVTQAYPKITAMDLFDVNLTLYPTLAGTTLSYVIILLQTTSSDSNCSNLGNNTGGNFSGGFDNHMFGFM